MMAYVGGVQVIKEDGSPPPDCAVGKESCGVLALENTSFSDNVASAAGGAVFVDRVAIIRIICSTKQTNREMNFYSKKQWKSMITVISTEDICLTWRNNSASRYGEDIASCATDVQKKISSEQWATEVSIKENYYEMLDHKSGAPLSVFSLMAVDDLGQCPAVGLDGKEITATMFSPDGLFDGRISVLLESDPATLTVTPFALPGEYTVLVEFRGGDIEVFEIAVYVRGCIVGEVLSANGVFCEPCSTTTYSFNPDEDQSCKECPVNGICTTRVILPDRGYWHPTPCSTHIQKCLSTDACDTDNRQHALEELTNNVESCDFSATFIKNYTEAQCSEVSTVFACGRRLLWPLCFQGYAGPLCGSCKKSHGSSLSSKCQECPAAISNVMVICASTVILLGLSGITMRGTLSTPSGRRMMLSGRRKISHSVRLKVLSQSSRTELPEMQASGSHEIHGTNELAERRHVSETTMAQWKAIEMFKV